MTPHRTQYGVNWILIIFWNHKGITIYWHYAYRMCFDCQWYINFTVMWIMDSRVLLANTRHLKSENWEKKNYRWCATTAMGFKGQRDFRHVGWNLHCKQAKSFVNVIQHGDVTCTSPIEGLQLQRNFLTCKYGCSYIHLVGSI